MKLDKKKTKSTLTLDGVCDVYQAEPLRAEFLAALEHGKPITVKTDEVTQLDTQCVQILVAAQQDFAAQEIDFGMAEPSDAVATALDRLGLTEKLLTQENAADE